jgi:hypothetical protein
VEEIPSIIATDDRVLSQIRETFKQENWDSEPYSAKISLCLLDYNPSDWNEFDQMVMLLSGRSSLIIYGFGLTIPGS